MMPNRRRREPRGRMLEAALEYARRGWPVLPIQSPQGQQCSCGNARCKSVGKHPRTKHGLRDATIGERQIRAWWNCWPDANVGIATGSASGVVVLDIDPRHGGDASLSALERKHGPLPQTLRVQSGGNGQHLYFRNPASPVKSRAGIAPGVDLRAEGAYIIAPPSLHASGNTYRLLDGKNLANCPLAELPTWLAERPQATRPAPAQEKARVSEGRRNTHLASLAGALVRKGLSEAGIAAALKIANQEQCDPPLPVEEVLKIAQSVGRYKPGGQTPKIKMPQTSQLIDLAEGVELFHDSDHQAWATIPVGGHRENYRLRDSGFRRWLAFQFFRYNQKAPSTEAMTTALGVLEGRALFEGPELMVFTRLASHDDAIYLDLANPDWQAVKISKSGWQVVADSPVKFRRTKGMLPLPYPVAGSSIKALRPFVNVASDDDWILLAGCLVGAFNPAGPHAVLVFHGEQGSAKSTLARAIRKVVDPNRSPLRAAPRDERDLAIAANNAWYVAFDNASYLPRWLSDAICRLATGGGFATRALYTDDEEKIFSSVRPVLLNGIDGLVVRGDLQDRAIMLDLPPISTEARRSEEEYWREFEQARPGILGALLDAACTALRRLPEVTLTRLPRMADFAKFVTAAEPALGWPKGAFIECYLANQTSSNAITLEASAVAPVIQRLVRTDDWAGTATELLKELNEELCRSGLEEPPQGWPRSPQALSTQLRRIAANLRRTGVDVQFSKTSGPRSERRITIRNLGQKSDASDACVACQVPSGGDSGAPTDDIEEGDLA